MNTKNISSNKKALEEIALKSNKIQKIFNIDLSSDSKEKKDTPIKNTKRNTVNTVSSDNLGIMNLGFTDKIFEINKELEKKIKEVNKKVNELDKSCKQFSTLDDFHKLKSEINNIKKDSNKYATNSELKAIYNKSEENEKEIKYIKYQIEDLEKQNNSEINDNLRSLQNKLELFINRVEDMDISYKALKKNLENEIKEREVLNDNIKIFLEKKIFENFKDQLAKEFTNINSNFIQTRKLLDDIVDELKEKVSYQDLKILEKNFAFKLESLHVNVLKKFVEKSETIKNFKHIEQQIRNIYELIQKRGGDNENWLIAKKPLNSNLCASCESYLGDLKNNNPYVPWNKYPLKDSNDKSYRYGSGYSKMLQMINIEENDKKNMSSFGIGMNFREELGNIIKKNEKNDFGDFNSDLNNNINFNKTMGNFSKSPKNNFPLIKKKFLLKNKSDNNYLDDYKTDEAKNQRNKNSELSDIKGTQNFGTNTENNDDELIINSPKISKIIKKK